MASCAALGSWGSWGLWAFWVFWVFGVFGEFGELVAESSGTNRGAQSEPVTTADMSRIFIEFS
jgi:hypothetical protein